jgi:PAS domain S-box-containing protein
MFYRHDTDHVLSYVSPQSEEFLGCSPEEAKRRWTEFVTDHPINEEGFKNTQQAIDTGEAQPPFPLQLKKATGEEIWVRVNEAPITENGETVGIVGSLTDITEQKEYEAKIEETNEKLTKAQEIAQLGYWEEDWETGEVYWSDQTYRIWGFDPEGTTITFEKIIERMHPEDVELFTKENQRTHEEHVPLDLQHRVVLPDRSIKWLNVFATVKKAEDGTPLSLEGTVQDITETKELEQLLQRTNRLAKVGSWEIDFSENDEGDVYWSEMTREMLEVDEDYQPTVEGSFSFFKPEDQERAREIFEEAVANGTSYDMEMKVQTAKGNERWIRNIGQPEFRDGECVRVYGSFQDIHERKTSELQLERRNEFIEKILNNLPIGISVHYIESGQNIWMNQKFSEIYGWPQEELPDVDTFFEKVFPDPEYREEIKSRVIADMESGDPERMQWSDLEITTKEGEKRFVDAKNIPLPEQNQMISSVVDITESKKHEQKLQESLELYEYVTKATDDVVYDWDIEKDILQWDDSFRDKFVYDVESGEYTIDYWAENVHPDDLSEAKSSLDDTLENTSESKWEKQYRFKKQDGTYAHVFERGFIIRDEEGHATRMIGSLQDITERIRYQEELEDLALVASKTTDIIIITDAKDRITWVNDAFEELTGYSYGEAIGKNPGKLLQGPKTDPATVQRIGKAVRNQESIQETVLNYTKSGDKYWLDLTIDPILDGEGNCEGFIAIEKDVTKQIKRQRELQESVERYDIVSKATSDTIWDLNLETDINRYNSNIYDMFGYEKQEVKNPAQWWREKIHPEDRDIVTTKMEQALEADFDRFQMEYRFQCADGSYKYIYDRAFIVHDEDGNPIRMIGAMQDVTQQREEQKWLQLFQSAIASTKESVAIIEAEPDESPGREILYVNEAFCSMTGYTQAEAKGETLAILNGPKTSQKERDKLSRAMKNWETEEAEFINYKKDGEEFWIRVSMTPVRGPNNSFSYWVCVGRDITERKQREKELQKSLKEKETLLLEIHHRVKNNLAVVSGMMQLQAFEEEDQQFKEKLFDGVVRIQTMSNIHELLYQSESFTDVAFHENLKKLTNQITDTFGKNVRVKTNFEFDEVHLNINQAIPCSLIVNEVITNVLKHAFGDQDEGEITISISEDDGKVYLQVTDDGIGEPPDLQEQRTAQSLGLKLIETLAQQLEADYEYRSLEDGAQFRLAFEKAQIKGSGSAHLV